MFKNFQMPPFYIFWHYATYRRPKKFEKKTKKVQKNCNFFHFFPHAGTVEENTWHIEALLLFLSLRYGANLGRSWLVFICCRGDWSVHRWQKDNDLRFACSFGVQTLACKFPSDIGIVYFEIQFSYLNVCPSVCSFRRRNFDDPKSITIIGWFMVSGQKQQTSISCYYSHHPFCSISFETNFHHQILV